MEEKFMLADEFANLIVEKVKDDILEFIKYRSTVSISEVPHIQDAVEKELRDLRNAIADTTYEKGAFKELLK